MALLRFEPGEMVYIPEEQCFGECILQRAVNNGVRHRVRIFDNNGVYEYALTELVSARWTFHGPITAG